MRWGERSKFTLYHMPRRQWEPPGDEAEERVVPGGAGELGRVGEQMFKYYLLHQGGSVL